VVFTLAFSLWDIVVFPIHPGLIALILNAAVFILCGFLLPSNKITSNKILLYQNGSFDDFQ